MVIFVVFMNCLCVVLKVFVVVLSGFLCNVCLFLFKRANAVEIGFALRKLRDIAVGLVWWDWEFGCLFLFLFLLFLFLYLL